MITDCHTHWGMNWKARYLDNPADWLAVLDRNGIDRALLMPHEGLVRHDRISQDNDAVCSTCERSGGRLVPIVTGAPQLGNACLTELRRCVEQRGARGFKFHPWIQGFSLADATFQEVCRYAAQAGVPIFFHDGTPTYSLPEQIIGLALRHGATTFVLAHGGLLWNWKTVFFAQDVQNLYVTLCGPHYRGMQEILRRIDSRRVLWGSDFGFSYTDSIRYRIALFRELHLGTEMERLILQENPMRLIGETLIP